VLSSCFNIILAIVPVRCNGGNCARALPRRECCWPRRCKPQPLLTLISSSSLPRVHLPNLIVICHDLVVVYPIAVPMHALTRPCLLSCVHPQACCHPPGLCDHSCFPGLIVALHHPTSYVVVRSTHAITLPPGTFPTPPSSLSRLCHPNVAHHACLLNLVVGFPT
jgi:hypothetical protein